MTWGVYQVGSSGVRVWVKILKLSVSRPNFAPMFQTTHCGLNSSTSWTAPLGCPRGNSNLIASTTLDSFLSPSNPQSVPPDEPFLNKGTAAHLCGQAGNLGNLSSHLSTCLGTKSGLFHSAHFHFISLALHTLARLEVRPPSPGRAVSAS